MAKLIKHLHIAERIVFIDGLWGSGKSILGPVLGSLKNVEKQMLEPIYERLCLLDNFNQINSDAAITLMRLFVDEAIYNSMISRKINLRIFDDSGVLNNPNSIKYITRLFSKDGNAALVLIRKTKPILQIMTHQILSVIDLAFRALGDRLKVVEIVRHPLYMINHWFNYIERCGSDPREFNLWIASNGQALPWFAQGWEEKYKRLKTMDKVIHSINLLVTRSNDTYDRLPDKQKEQILFIPFERFVIEPLPFIKKLESFLNTEATAATKRALKQQRCPRKCLTAGRGHRHYGWKKPSRQINDFIEFKKKQDFVNSLASKESVAILDRLCREYEDRFSVFKDSSWDSIRVKTGNS